MFNIKLESEAIYRKIKVEQNIVKHMESEDYLHALETTGKILLFTPIIVSLILFIGGIPDREPFTGAGASFANGLMMSSGFFMLVYVAVMKFKQGLKKAK